jgi:hypothetical protein
VLEDLDPGLVEGSLAHLASVARLALQAVEAPLEVDHVCLSPVSPEKLFTEISQLASLLLAALLDSLDLPASADRLGSQVAEALQALAADRGKRSSRPISTFEEAENCYEKPSKLLRKRHCQHIMRMQEQLRRRKGGVTVTPKSW